VTDTGQVLGNEFTHTLRDAQAGKEDAFVRLWRDANPLMIRYLRVVGHDDPYDAACEGWVTVVRGLPGFTGDEVAWYVFLLACARLRAEEGNLRQAWDAVTVLPGIHVEDDLNIDDLLDPDQALDPTRRGVNDSLTALRELPLGQGEVLVLRLGAGLPSTAVADIIGVDVDNVLRAETRGLHSLDTNAELLSWSLSAPGTFSEFADEPVALGAFRAIPRRPRHPERPRVIALGAASGRAALAVGARSSRTVGRSRTAVLALTAVSASAVSLGGLSAAAYVGVLPQPVQQAMHEAIGAPAPEPDAQAVAQAQKTQATRAVRLLTPSGASHAVDLCRSWASDRASGVTGDRSEAFRSLASAAGGAGAVDPYCTLLVPVPGVTTPSTLPSLPSSSSTTSDDPTTTTPTTDAPTDTPSSTSTPPTTPSDPPTDPPTDTTPTPTDPPTAPDPGTGDDTGPGAGTTDSGPSDAGAADSGAVDSAPADPAPADLAPVDLAPVDLAPADSGFAKQDTSSSSTGSDSASSNAPSASELPSAADPQVLAGP
jgi:DNA-directed RNA polymerase specialized sigma24 family protein